MPFELSIDQDVTPKIYLSMLLKVYPYDIEEKIVFSLLEKDTYPHPSLLIFLSYFSKYPKYCMNKETRDMTMLFKKMSMLKQRNKTVLHTYQFHFDAFFNVKRHKNKMPYAHLPLSSIPFIDTILLYSTPYLVMEHPYELQQINKSEHFIYKDISIDPHDYFAISIKIGDKYGIIYLPRHELRMAIAISMLYEVTLPPDEVDFLLLYGVAATKHELSYYFDETNRLYIGLISGIDRYHHFLYIKDMITTLYNSICIEKRDLPIHGSMLEIYTKHRKYGLILMGEAHTGKSEIIDAIKQECQMQQIKVTSVFDDSGILHYLDNDISATGTQIGACIGVRDFPQERIFQQFSSIALLTSQNKTTHILLPFTDHKTTSLFHKVDGIIYLDNYSKHLVFHKVDQLATAVSIFKQGKYLDMNQKVRSSFFCNSFGCPQQYQIVNQMIDDFFNLMFINNLSIYVISTHLTKQNKDHLYTQRAFEILREILL